MCRRSQLGLEPEGIQLSSRLLSAVSTPHRILPEGAHSFQLLVSF